MKKIYLLVITSVYNISYGQVAPGANCPIPDAQHFISSDNDFCITSPAYKLVFHDEFDGNTLNTSKWYTYEPEWQPNGTVNDQALHCRTNTNNQIYKDENIIVSNGTCKILTKKENATWFGQTKNYTTGWLQTKATFPYFGKYEIRCKLPKGRLLWPAFWIWGGENVTPDRNGYSEIDIFEFHDPGHNKWKMESASHHRWTIGSNPTVAKAQGKLKILDNLGDLSTGWHTYSAEFDPKQISFYVDGVLVNTISKLIVPMNQVGSGTEVTSCNPNIPNIYNINPAFPFVEKYNSGNDCRIFLRSLIASGGVSYGKNGVSDFAAPNLSTFEIDYIRVYERWLGHNGDANVDLCSGSIGGSNKICASINSTTFTIQTPENLPANWSISANLEVQSQNNYQITVKPKSTSVLGQIGTINASVNFPCGPGTVNKK